MVDFAYLVSTLEANKRNQQEQQRRQEEEQTWSNVKESVDIMDKRKSDKSEADRKKAETFGKLSALLGKDSRSSEFKTPSEQDAARLGGMAGQVGREAAAGENRAAEELQKLRNAGKAKVARGGVDKLDPRVKSLIDTAMGTGKQATSLFDKNRAEEYQNIANKIARQHALGVPTKQILAEIDPAIMAEIEQQGGLVKFMQSQQGRENVARGDAGLPSVQTSGSTDTPDKDSALTKRATELYRKRKGSTSQGTF